MQTQLVHRGDITYLAGRPGALMIHQERDILDLLTLVSEYETDRILLHYDNLSPRFFDLRSGLAGELMQKFANYRIKAVIVLPIDQIESQRFRELVLESNKGRQFRFYEHETDAVAWLVN